MHIRRLGPIIATRRFSVAVDKYRTEKPIVLKLGKPRRFPNSNSKDYFCPFCIEGAGEEKIRYAAGVDAFQALQEAIRMLGMLIHLKINPKFGGRLRWEGDEHGDLGLPRFES